MWGAPGKYKVHKPGEWPPARRRRRRLIAQRSLRSHAPATPSCSARRERVAPSACRLRSTQPPPTASPPAAGCHCPNCHKAKKLNEAGATLEVVPTEALLAPPPEAVPEGGEEQLHREQMRRKRISEANRGKTAWNKGLRHSEETKAKIRERTMQAMQSPELRKRLSEAAAAQRHTPETREKIKAAARVRAERRKYELCLIFAAALAWARVSRADRHLPGESWLGPRFLLPEKRSALRSGAQASRAPETRKQGSLPSIFSSRGPKSPEHRAKISASIRAKWRQPVRVRATNARFPAVPLATCDEAHFHFSFSFPFLPVIN